MGYQSEAELENKLIEKLKTQGYERVLINDYSELENNFREQLNKFNKKALDEKPLTDKEVIRKCRRQYLSSFKSNYCSR